MILYDLSKTCTDAALAHFVNLAKHILNLIQLIVPIILIVMMVVIFIKMMINPDDKKLVKNMRNSFISLVVVFFLPIIVNAVMLLFDDSFKLSECWNYSEEIKNTFGSTYISVDTDERKNIFIDSDQYESGTEKVESKGESVLTGTGLGRATKFKIEYNKKDKQGRCGKGSGDFCAQIATVTYPKGKVTYYMGYQNNSQLLGGSCRSHAFTCGLNATNGSYYNTLDIQNFLYSTGDNGVLKGRARFNKTIDKFGAKAKAYFSETSIQESLVLAREALDNGQPVIIFVANSKCSDLAGSHHALLLLGYDNNNNVVFLDSCSRYPSAKKRTLEELILGCMSGDSVAENWMRMVIFSF